MSVHPSAFKAYNPSGSMIPAGTEVVVLPCSRCMAHGAVHAPHLGDHRYVQCPDCKGTGYIVVASLPDSSEDPK